MTHIYFYSLTDTLVARSSLFVWVGDALTVTCVAMPTVTQTNLVLKRNGVNVASLGFSVNKENNVQDPNTGSQVSMLTAVKTQASMSDGVEYTCVACALSNSQCSGQVYLEAKRTVIVGEFIQTGLRTLQNLQESFYNRGVRCETAFNLK